MLLVWLRERAGKDLAEEERAGMGWNKRGLVPGMSQDMVLILELLKSAHAQYNAI